MASPSNLYLLYTNAELAAALVLLKEEINGGQVGSLGGAAKTSSFNQIPADVKMKALILEMRRRGLSPPRAQKVVQILNPGCDPFPGAYAGGCFP